MIIRKGIKKPPPDLSFKTHSWNYGAITRSHHPLGFIYRLMLTFYTEFSSIACFVHDTIIISPSPPHSASEMCPKVERVILRMFFTTPVLAGFPKSPTIIKLPATTMARFARELTLTHNSYKCVYGSLTPPPNQPPSVKWGSSPLYRWMFRLFFIAFTRCLCERSPSHLTGKRQASPKSHGTVSGGGGE